MKATVYVTYRPGVLEPQGQTVSQFLRSHGRTEVRDVRIGKMIEFDLCDMSREAALDLLNRISDELLANPVIETYRIEVP